MFQGLGLSYIPPRGTDHVSEQWYTSMYIDGTQILNSPRHWYKCRWYTFRPQKTTTSHRPSCCSGLWVLRASWHRAAVVQRDSHISQHHGIWWWWWCWGGGWGGGGWRGLGCLWFVTFIGLVSWYRHLTDVTYYVNTLSSLLIYEHSNVAADKVLESRRKVTKQSKHSKLIYLNYDFSNG